MIGYEEAAILRQIEIEEAYTAAQQWAAQFIEKENEQ